MICPLQAGKGFRTFLRLIRIAMLAAAGRNPDL